MLEFRRARNVISAVSELTGAKTAEERAFIYSLLLPFVVMNPILLSIHGYIWLTSQKISSALAVYAMKLSPVIYLAMFATYFGLREVMAAVTSRLAVALSPLLIIGALVPFFVQAKPSPFYFAADLIGLTTTIACITVTCRLLNKSGAFVTILFNVMIGGALVTSLFILFYFVISGGAKVSIPPDIHYGISLVFLLALSSRLDSWPMRVIAVVVAVAIPASQFRMHMIIAGLSIVGGLFWTFMHYECRIKIRRSIEAFILVLIMLLSIEPMAADTIRRIMLVDWGKNFSAMNIYARKSNIPAPDAFTTADQRSIEIRLVIGELVRSPLGFITGFGFGATALNIDGTLPNKPDRLHSIHNSLAAIMLRNGIVGALVFLLPAALAVRSLRSRRRDLYVASASLIVVYSACSTDQYVYWGGYFGFSVAAVLALRRKTVGGVKID